MASAASASPGALFDTPSNGTRSARRKPDGPTRSPGAPLVIPIGRGSAATQQTAPAERAGPSIQQQQQQQAEVQQPPLLRQQQQQQQQQSTLRQRAPPAAADADVIVIDSDDDDTTADDDEVVITGVTVGQKRPRQQPPPQQRQAGLMQQRQQQQVQHVPRRVGVPAMPTWEQPAAPVQPPSPEPAFKCLICLEGIKPDNMATTPCGHMFCFDCIMDATRVTRKCPKCRKNTTLKAIKRLYPN